MEALDNFYCPLAAIGNDTAFMDMMHDNTLRTDMTDAGPKPRFAEAVEVAQTWPGRRAAMVALMFDTFKRPPERGCWSDLAAALEASRDEAAALVALTPLLHDTRLNMYKACEDLEYWLMLAKEIHDNFVEDNEIYAHWELKSAFMLKIMRFQQEAIDSNGPGARTAMDDTRQLWHLLRSQIELCRSAIDELGTPSALHRVQLGKLANLLRSLDELGCKNIPPVPPDTILVDIRWHGRAVPTAR